MNCLVYDHAEMLPRALRNPSLGPLKPDGEDDAVFKSTLFGPTCDGMDIVTRDYALPSLRNGDFVLFPRFGAYTLAGAVNFNGFHVADVPFFYINSS